MPTESEHDRPAARARLAEAYRRARYTPLVDAVRLRLTARLDPRKIYRDLPRPAEDLVRTVARKTRLLRVERADVARELASHFHEGLHSGASPEELVQSFGDPRAAATLIRRAKRRARPLPHKLVTWTTKSLLAAAAVVVISWGLLAWSYYGSSPGPMPDRLAKFNARAAAIPEEENAWPIYLEAAFAMQPLPPSGGEPEGREQRRTDWNTLQVAQTARPGEVGWDLAVDRANRNTEAIYTIHSAASRPRFGLELSTDIAQWQGDLSEHRYGERFDQGSGPPKLPLVEALLGHLGEFRRFSYDLALDARVAIAQDNFERATQSLIALQRLAAHLDQDPWSLSRIVACSISETGTRAIGESLLLHGERFTREQLTRIAHTLAGWDPTVDFENERAQVLELIDATFAPNGRAADLDTLDEFLSTYDDLRAWTPDEHLFEEQPIALSIARPLLARIIAPSDEQIDMLLQHTAYYHAQAARQPWEREPIPERLRLEDDTLRALRFAPVTATGDRSRPIDIRDRTRLHRDTLLTAIAIELYRRDTGTIPQSLSDIPTKLLPSPPLDPADGQLVRYRFAESSDKAHVKQAGYLLYTIGPDLKDDHGAPGKHYWSVRPNLDWSTPIGERKPPAEGDYPVYPRKPGTVDLDTAADLGLIDPVEHWSATDN
ncbi:MAG: hypothetical protein AAGG07_01290 [Planctomycetota bacterium]